MGSLHDAEFAAAFDDLAEEFGETITYAAFEEDVVELTCPVLRGPLTSGGPGALTLAEGEIVIDVAMAEISAVRIGVDEVTLAARPGGEEETFTVKKILGQSGGFWRLKVR